MNLVLLPAFALTPLMTTAQASADALYDKCLSIQGETARGRYRDSGASVKREAAQELLGENLDFLGELYAKLNRSENQDMLKILASMEGSATNAALAEGIAHGSHDFFEEIRTYNYRASHRQALFSGRFYQKKSSLRELVSTIPGGKSLTFRFCNETIDLPSYDRGPSCGRPDTSGVHLCSELVYETAKNEQGNWITQVYARGNTLQTAALHDQRLELGESASSHPCPRSETYYRKVVDEREWAMVSFDLSPDGIPFIDLSEADFVKAEAEKACINLKPAQK